MRAAGRTGPGRPPSTELRSAPGVSPAQTDIVAPTAATLVLFGMMQARSRPSRRYKTIRRVGIALEGTELPVTAMA